VTHRYNTWFYREFVWKRPRWLAVLLPIVVVWVSWTTAMTALDEFHLFEDKYFMTITMLFGACTPCSGARLRSSVAFVLSRTLMFCLRARVWPKQRAWWPARHQRARRRLPFL
jgi:hypothetical protein